MYRSESKYESSLGHYRSIDKVTTGALELPSFLGERDLVHHVGGLLELTLAHAGLVDRCNVRFPKMKKGSSTKHLKGALGSTRKYLQCFPNVHSRSVFSMQNCFRESEPSLEDPVAIAFAERRAALGVFMAESRLGLDVTGVTRPIVHAFDPAALMQYQDTARMNQPALNHRDAEEAVEELLSARNVQRVKSLLEAHPALLHRIETIVNGPAHGGDVQLGRSFGAGSRRMIRLVLSSTGRACR